MDGFLESHSSNRALSSFLIDLSLKFLIVKTGSSTF